MTFPNDQRGDATRLVVRSPPDKLEALSGYMLRLTHLNGYKKLAWLVGSIPGSIRSRAGLTHTIPDLAQVAGVPEDLLRRHAYFTPKGSYTWFLGHKFLTRFLNIRDPKVCSQCLKRRMVLPFYWDFEFFCACPEHGTLLLSACPACDKKLSWGRRCLHQCDCGYDLRRSASQAAPAPLVWYSSVLLSKLGIGAPHQNGGAEQYIPALSLNDLFLLTVFFGGLSATSPVRQSLYAIERKTGDLSTWVERTAAVLLGWPDAFHTELGRLRRDAGLSPRSGFTPLIRYLRQIRTPSFDFVKEEFALFVQRQSEMRRFAHPPSGRGKAPGRAMSSDMLGVGKKVERQLIADGVLETERYRAASKSILTKENVETLISRLEEIAAPPINDGRTLRPLALGARLIGRRNAAKLVEMAFNGKIRIFLTAPHERGLKRYSVAEDEIVGDLLETEIYDQDFISSHSARAMLRCSDHQLHYLLAANVIRKTHRKRREGSGIFKSDVIKFSTDYTLCSALAAELGVAPLTMKKITEYLLIWPMPVPGAKKVPIFWLKEIIDLRYRQITCLVDLFKQHASHDHPWNIISYRASALLAEIQGHKTCVETSRTGAVPHLTPVDCLD